MLKPLKYTNIIAFNIIIQSKFPHKNNFLIFLILILWNKLISGAFYFLFHGIK